MPEDPHPLPPPTAWFARDAERHLLDAPRHCPRCGAPVSGSAGLVVEYWVGEDRVFYCWCRACDWTGTIVHLQRHVGHEAAEQSVRRVVQTRALVLDFGGPVLRTPFELLRATERRLGLPPWTFDWRGPFDPDADPLWQRLQARMIGEPDYWAARAAEFATVTGRSGVRAMMRELFRGPEDEVVRSEAVAAMRAARVLGCRVGVLTNDLALFHDEEWVAGIRILTEVDAVVDAARLGVRKPDPGAYRAALDVLAVTASEAVLVDDQPVNVEGAQAVGIPAVLFDVVRPAESYARALTLLGARS